MTRAALRAAAGVAAVAAALALTAAPASAHTTLTAANPAKDSAVAAPSQIVLTYADPVRLPRVVVTDGSRKPYQAGTAQAVDNKVTQAVGALPNGKYTVGWRVVASDGHPVEGSYTFTVKGSSGAAQPAAPAPSATKAASSEGGSSGWLWIGLIVLVLAIAAGAIAWFRRTPHQD
ncbi:copper resistance protein CopC [Actinomadura darangshiensis]|uniref:Copper resistance protein CopC n=1 Tax=Actinomadura darangshiensis TaxID=705336 RepID=A0A4V2YRZ7_9ACTN|nr:copper resistance CopC family protein [Actinomadura darangshiensis]TDD67467.1 copper resistance protein CopC [Actinomadura darangshiensis]